MKKKRFAYVFAIGGPARVEWSGEDADFIINRRVVTADKEEVRDFCKKSKPGNFITTSTGEMIFNIS